MGFAHVTRRSLNLDDLAQSSLTLWLPRISTRTTYNASNGAEQNESLLSTMFTLVVLLIIFVPQCIAFFRFGRRPSGSRVDMEGIMSLGELNDDVLYMICSFINEGPCNFTGVKRHKPHLDSFSRTNHRLRHLSMPMLFRNIAIKGGWDDAMRAVEQMEVCPAIARNARFAASCQASYSIHWLTLHDRSLKFHMWVNEEKSYPPPQSVAPRLCTRLH